MPITNDNRRAHEAYSLRAFFNEQLQHLHGLLDHFSVDDTESATDEEMRVVESFVDTANNKMRAVQGYADKLRGHVCALFRHVLDVAAQIPPPIELNATALRTSPIINALFVDQRDLDRLISANAEIDAYLRSHGTLQVPVLYALLTANRTEKSILGVGMLGDLLVRDVAQQTVNFHGHKLLMPCADSEQLSAAIKTYLFDRVVTLIRREMAARRMAESLTPGDRSYRARVNSLDNPDIYLHSLLEHLENPDQLLRIETSHLILNKLGMKLDQDDRQCRNEFELHEITWSDRSRNVVLTVAYPR